MNSDHHAILSLVAMGRITPREAERLLAVSREADDTVLHLALCFAFAALALPYVANGFDAAGSALAALLPPIVRAVSLMAGIV